MFEGKTAVRCFKCKELFAFKVMTLKEPTEEEWEKLRMKLELKKIYCEACNE